MPSYYDDVDLYFTRGGDFWTHAGDLKDTHDDGLRSLVQDLISICKSSTGDWELYPGLGASVDEFRGRLNTKKVANLIHDRIRASIVSSGIVSESDLSISIFPVSKQEIVIILRILALETAFNKLGSEESLVVEFLYSYGDKGYSDGTPWLDATMEVMGIWGSGNWGAWHWG